MHCWPPKQFYSFRNTHLSSNFASYWCKGPFLSVWGKILFRLFSLRCLSLSLVRIVGCPCPVQGVRLVTNQTKRSVTWPWRNRTHFWLYLLVTRYAEGRIPHEDQNTYQDQHIKTEIPRPTSDHLTINLHRPSLPYSPLAPALYFPLNDS